jgi:hypothetical protein
MTGGVERSGAGSGIEIAGQWAKLPPEHLAVAFSAMEPQLAREHEYRIEELKARGQAEVRAHELAQRGQNFGLVIALSMLVAAIVLAFGGMQALAGVFAGPSLLALAKLFVLRRSDASDMKAVTDSRGRGGAVLSEASAASVDATS